MNERMATALVALTNGELPHSKGSPANIEAAVILGYEAGLTIRQISAAIGWSYGKVHGLLRRAGVQMRSRGSGSATAGPELWMLFRKQPSKRQEIGRLLAEGDAVATIGRKLHIATESAIARHIAALKSAFGVSTLDQLRRVLRRTLAHGVAVRPGQRGR